MAVRVTFVHQPFRERRYGVTAQAAGVKCGCPGLSRSSGEEIYSVLLKM
ncbi:MAG: hypothetical protein ACI4J2_02435 [Ruminococcus sp.]|nr:hypothetical protein [Ruminococcus sp.]MDD6099036.1 hypothetical protein [Oscillospiraceae bacterium]